MSAHAPREAIAEPVRRVLRWMLGLRDARGHLVCPEHRIEHTGKNAGVLVMACELVRSGADGERDALLEVVVQQGRRLCERLQREGDTTCHTFRPGRHDPYNCSNNVIDGGACSDALAEAVRTFGERLAPADREAFARASVLHAQTYLRYAALEKGVPAQRAWAMTGVAAAYGLARHAVLELATREGAAVLAADQHADGSYPYHPLAKGAGHVGASDVSAFYQSRVTGFLTFALERVGIDPASRPHADAIRRGLAFLLALQGPDGRKCGLVEAKPWYWGATYEVASHPFDAYALGRGFHHLGDAAFGAGARRAFRAWAALLDADGRPRDHLPGPDRRRSYQCPVFWAGHASWMARAMADLEQIEARGVDEPAAPRPAVLHFADADLVRLEDAAVVAWVRGRRPGYNAHHGSPCGGLLGVVSRPSGEELLTRHPLAADDEGEWRGRAGVPALRRGWRAGAEELRFSLWLARNELRRGHPGAALATPGRVAWRALAGFASPRVSSSFERAPSLHLRDGGVLLEGGLAWRGGAPVEGSRLVRAYRVDGGGLLALERLEATGRARGVAFRVPARAREVERTSSPAAVRYRLV